MKKFFWFLAVSRCLLASGWSPPATITTDSTVENVVNLAYDPQSQQLFAAWVDDDNFNPYYSIYSSGVWSVGNSVTERTATSPDVFLAYNPSYNQEMFAAFYYMGRNNFTSSYNGTAWNSPQEISDSVKPGLDTFLAYSGTSLFASWADRTYGTAYSIFDSSSNSWFTPASIDASSHPVSNVYMATQSNTGTLFAAWVDNSTGNPMYATYNQNSDTWSSAPIASVSAGPNVNLTYQPSTGAMFAAWISNQTIYYSIYNGSWSTPQTIPGSLPIQYFTDVYLLGIGSQVFAAWGGAATLFPYYSIYTNGSWSTPQPIAQTQIFGNPSLAYNASTNQVFAAWEPYNTPSYPYYSTYNLTTTVPVTAKRVVNDFGTLTEVFYVLTWQAPSTITPSSYTIYRNGVLIATVPASQLTYEDHDVSAKVKYTYTVVPNT